MFWHVLVQSVLKKSKASVSCLALLLVLVANQQWNKTTLPRIDAKMYTGGSGRITWPDNRLCALDAPGRFNKLGHFQLTRGDSFSSPQFPTQRQCEWIDYTHKILPKKEALLSLTQLEQKQKLVRKKRHVLLFGDSQERNIVKHLCDESQGSVFETIDARWMCTNSSNVSNTTAICNSSKHKNLSRCRIGNLIVANFFHFGLMGHHKLADQHTDRKESEPVSIIERIKGMLPFFIEDAFGSISWHDVTDDVRTVVINSGLWDLLAISTHETWREEVKTLAANKIWAQRAEDVSTAIHSAVLNSSKNTNIFWRNLPGVIESRTKTREYIHVGAYTNPFTEKMVEDMNDVGESVARGLGWRKYLAKVQETPSVISPSPKFSIISSFCLLFVWESHLGLEKFSATRDTIRRC